MGEEFGIGGHMHIERGKNTFAIEQTIAGFDVELLAQDSPSWSS